MIPDLFSLSRLVFKHFVTSRAGPISLANITCTIQPIGYCRNAERRPCHTLSAKNSPSYLRRALLISSIPTRTNPGVFNGNDTNTQHTATSSGTVFAALMVPVVSNSPCSGSCSYVLYSGSNLGTVLMGALFGVEPDNCQCRND